MRLREALFAALGGNREPFVKVEAAHALMSATRLDLLVTNVGLPAMDGRQLEDAARELRPDMKVLFITGTPIPLALVRGWPFRPAWGW